jgi:hypothetical protein
VIVEVAFSKTWTFLLLVPVLVAGWVRSVETGRKEIT